jgi:hypothetical protein
LDAAAWLDESTVALRREPPSRRFLLPWSGQAVTVTI